MSFLLAFETFAFRSERVHLSPGQLLLLLLLLWVMLRLLIRDVLWANGVRSEPIGLVGILFPFVVLRSLIGISSRFIIFESVPLFLLWVFAIFSMLVMLEIPLIPTLFSAVRLLNQLIESVHFWIGSIGAHFLSKFPVKSFPELEGYCSLADFAESGCK